MKNIYITKPFLPPLDEYTLLLKEIWESRTLTNNGPFNKKFELQLAKYLGVEHVSLVNNATSGLMIALKAMQIKGEVITTPFSFIATSHAIKWNGLDPVFVDTDNHIGNLKVDEIEKKITKKTGGILAVHNYGVPGDLENMEALAKKYKLPIIYDAAPALGVKLDDESLLKFGDLSIVSFHATKIFTTFEGGAIISQSKSMKNKIDSIRNFGIKNEYTVEHLGINAKMSEPNAALGLLQLKYFDSIIEERKHIYNLYKEGINKFVGCSLINLPKNLKYNFAYCPIIFENGIKARDRAYNKMQSENIFCRKYWYPLITDQKIYSSANYGKLINAKTLSQKILFLPIYPRLEEKVVFRILKIINEV